MEAIYLLIPIAIVLTAIIVGIFFWAIRSGQFDDLEGPAHRILMEDDDSPDSNKPPDNDPAQTAKGHQSHR